MPKIYKEKPVKSVIDLHLEDKDSHYHNRYKAKLLADSGLSGTFQYKNFTITILDLPHVRDTNAGHKDEWLELSIEAVDDTGKQIFIDNPCQWQNPRCKVHDGTFHKEIIRNQEMDIPNYEVNPLEALKQQIGQLVELMAKGTQNG